MSAAADVNLADIPERIQSEVQRAIRRSIKGVEYLSTSGPTLGSTPKDILHTRGTMNLYHYRPLADEVYRVPVLIVMATTNRGYILHMLPGQSLIEFLLKRGCVVGQSCRASLSDDLQSKVDTCVPVSERLTFSQTCSWRARSPVTENAMSCSRVMPSPA
jgi:hypothetical protein